jgi:hypothetical protein
LKPKFEKTGESEAEQTKDAISRSQWSVDQTSPFEERNPKRGQKQKYASFVLHSIGREHPLTENQADGWVERKTNPLVLVSG